MIGRHTIRVLRIASIVLWLYLPLGGIIPVLYAILYSTNAIEICGDYSSLL